MTMLRPKQYPLCSVKGDFGLLLYMLIVFKT